MQHVTKMQWDAASLAYDVNEAIYCALHSYYEKGWLSEEGWQEAVAAYQKAADSFEETRRAYFDDCQCDECR